MTDITVRYMPEADVTMEKRRVSHRNVFWPAWCTGSPSLRPMVFALMTRVQATELGSILITRLPPGKMIEPHSDAGNWAPEFYSTGASHHACRKRAGALRGRRSHHETGRYLYVQQSVEPLGGVYQRR